MKERSIICRDDEVRAFLEGRKTQLRRPCIVPSEGENGGELVGVVPSSLVNRGDLFDAQYRLDNPRAIRCPFGIAGDRLWVRECWAPMCASSKTRVAYRSTMTIQNQTPRRGRAHDLVPWPVDNTGRVGHTVRAWRSSSQMPRWASRITLEIVNVRVERLQDITEEDANAEGIVRDDWGVYLGRSLPQGGPNSRDRRRCARDAFMSIWDSIHGGKDKQTRKPIWSGWAQNPFVWVIETKVIA